MKKYAGKWTIAAALMAASLLGCEPRAVIQPAPPAPGFTVPPSQSAATNALVTLTDQFDANVERLPGSSAEDHRQILLALLDGLPKILRLANGSIESPDFHNRVLVIEAARETISDSSIERRRMEAVENQALQAAGPALADIASKYLYDDDQLPPLLAALSDQADAAAGSTGPMHDLDATHAFVAMQAAVDRVTGDMADRFLGS
jgi:hypothetical protein